MFNPCRAVLLAITTIISVSLAAPSSSTYTGSILYEWSKHPACASTTTVPDCKEAAALVCASENLTVSSTATVGGCTAWYWYDVRNTVPTRKSCNGAYAHILASGIGGALGYSANGSRTNEPLYAIFPSSGNGNCFKAPGDRSAPLAAGTFANGHTLSTCPSSTSRRRAAQVFDSQEHTSGHDASKDSQRHCIIEETIWGYSCSATCLATVATTSWM